MISPYINDWLTIIEQMNNDNTYKLAWGRAVLECVILDNYQINNGEAVIQFDSISRFMMKYYWNQLFFFNLKQGPYKDKKPVICFAVESLIERYKSLNSTVISVWFEDAEKFFLKNDKEVFSKTISKISKELHNNVCWRFLRVVDGTKDIYQYEVGKSQIRIKLENVPEIKEYGVVLSKLLNYKWAQLLEKFNYAPKIMSKVNGLSDTKIKRNNLSKYKEELLKEFENSEVVDFYSGNPLKKEDITLDHVIPWSFCYSDDIWNLVITSKSNNSSKSNSIPSEETINRLKERNQKIKDLLSKNYKMTMDEAIEIGLVDRYFLECRL